MIDPGKLNQSVVIQSPGTPVADSDGGYTDGWAAISPSPIYGAFYSASTRAMDRVAGQNAVLSTATHIFESHYHSGITTVMRLKIGTRLFNIRGVQNVDEKDEMTRLFLEEVVA